MSAAQLVVYLTQLSSRELRIDFAREILAKNMNFSPAWIISVLKESGHPQENQFMISNLAALLIIIKMPIVNNDIVTLFEYFDIKKYGKIAFADFINSLLPVNNQALKNAVIKRISNDMQFSFELKYAIKRLFLEILQTQKAIKSYQIVFPQLPLEQFGEIIQKQKIKQFLQKFGKYPTDSQLNVLEKMIRDNKIRGVNAKQIKRIIKENQKIIKQIQNKENKTILIPSSLLTLMPSQQLSPIKSINQIKNNSPIKKLIAPENKDQIKSPIKNILKSNSKQINKKQQYKSIHENQLNSKTMDKQLPLLKVARTTSILQTPEQYQHKNTNSNKTGICISKEKNREQKLIQHKYKTLEKYNRSQQLKNRSAQKIRNPSTNVQYKSNEKQKESYLDLLIKNNKQMDQQLDTIKKNNKKRKYQMKQDLQKLYYK